MKYEVVEAQFVMDEKDKIPLVDVRSVSACKGGMVPWAINIPFDFIKQESVGANGPDESIEMARKLGIAFEDHSIWPLTPVIVMCQCGYHAKLVCEMLYTQGFKKLYLYKGGIEDWVKDPSRPVA